MSSRLPFFRSRQIPVKGLIAFAIQTTELGRSSSLNFVTRLACLSALTSATRIPRSTTSSTPVEPPLAPSSFPRPRPLLLTIILGSCLQPSDRRRGMHTLILIISFLGYALWCDTTPYKRDTSRERGLYYGHGLLDYHIPYDPGKWATFELRSCLRNHE
ncbi:hypothetical protein BDV93DRAFT_106657 [Ceratobasidium sp. AG-I]|nr:hypothetical protein BDV93DRAFT_106657 [Ceratobasidium sp. AG-I]